MGFKALPTFISLFIGLLIWFVVPVPSGVDPNAWHLLAMFVGVIAAIIGKAMPIGAIAIIAITLVAVTGVTNDSPSGAIQDALSSFFQPFDLADWYFDHDLQRLTENRTWRTLRLFIYRRLGQENHWYRL